MLSTTCRVNIPLGTGSDLADPLLISSLIMCLGKAVEDGTRAWAPAPGWEFHLT